jgi:16S rRNA (guanine527-N7)-methyltransferase
LRRRLCSVTRKGSVNQTALYNPMTQPADADTIRRLLRDVASGLALALNQRQLEQLTTHFALLLEWNRKINLTSLRQPEEIAARHFGESLFLTRLLPLSEPVAAGLLVDVGSGAGFPGLPLKSAWPWLPAILLEPNQKKAVFLKEVVRSCKMEGVEVRAERLKEALDHDCAGRASLVTVRAVAASPDFVGDIRRLLQRDGEIALFLGAKDAQQLAKVPGFRWRDPVAIPQSERRVILIGQAVSLSMEGQVLKGWKMN